jgi:signal transduction histidine kinase
LSIGCDVGEDAATLHFTNRLKNDQRVQADKIFNRFYKEDPSRTLHSSGLGLSIVKSLVEKMGGSAQVGLEENSFRLSLTFTRIQEESG